MGRSGAMNVSEDTKTLVIIPAYNEEESLARVVAGGAVRLGLEEVLLPELKHLLWDLGR